jgi:hypothetical protein
MIGMLMFWMMTYAPSITLEADQMNLLRREEREGWTERREGNTSRGSAPACSFALLRHEEKREHDLHKPWTEPYYILPSVVDDDLGNDLNTPVGRDKGRKALSALACPAAEMEVRGENSTHQRMTPIVPSTFSATWFTTMANEEGRVVVDVQRRSKSRTPENEGADVRKVTCSKECREMHSAKGTPSVLPQVTTSLIVGLSREKNRILFLLLRSPPTAIHPLRTMPPSHVEPPTLTRFRQVEKHYKLRQDPRNPKRYYRPSLEDVNLLDDSRSGELSPTGWSECKGRLETFPVGKVAGGDGTRAVKAFGVRSIPGRCLPSSLRRLTKRPLDLDLASGLVILPSYFSPSSQRTLIRSVLSTHTRPPNQTNLDTHFVLPSPSLFSAYASSFYPSLSSSSSSSASCKVPEFPSSPPTEVLVPTRASLPASAGDSTRYVKEQTGRILIENPPGEALGTPEELARGKKREILPIEPSKKVKAKTARELIKELRWTNLGLFYDVSLV